MKLKLLASAALVAALAAPAMADKPDDGADAPSKLVELVDPKDPNPPPPEVKGAPGGGGVNPVDTNLDSLEALFEASDGRFLQQQRVEQIGKKNTSDINQDTSEQSLASVRQTGNGNNVDTVQRDTDFPDGGERFSNPANASVVEQTGGNNDASVYQDGIANDASPFANRADIHQYAADADAADTITNTASITQDSNVSTLAVIAQGSAEERAENNFATISQTDNNNAFAGIDQDGNGNTADAIQTGVGSFSNGIRSDIEIQQIGGIGGGTYNTARVEQTGDGYSTGFDLDAFVRQEHVGTAGANNVDVSQEGNQNTFRLSQFGGANDVTGNQSGWGNLIAINQVGDANTVLEFDQSGESNIFEVHQDSSEYAPIPSEFSDVAILDASYGGNSVDFAEQSGWGNLTNIQQKGNGNAVDYLSQTGRSGEILIAQFGVENSVSATQASVNDVISVRQAGHGNSSVNSQTNGAP